MIRLFRNEDKAEVISTLTRSGESKSNEEALSVAKEILNKVQEKGDQALRTYTRLFDGVEIDTFLVSQDEMNEAMQSITPSLKAALQQAHKNISLYHERQCNEGYVIEEKERMLGQLVKPLANVGLYVPGGSAAYPSTVLMTAVPAKIAGVKEVIMITPPRKDGTIQPAILAAAVIAGVDKIYKVGGAQGIAAIAYGTETVPKVAKIVGPGNSYVAAAKKLVSSFVGIDMVAGPSEIVIIADESANPTYVAADLMSQAEHDEDAAAILLTDSAMLAEGVQVELQKQMASLSRKPIIASSLASNGAIVITSSIAEAIEISNELAPEHLQLLTENPLHIVDSVENAGAIFIGEYSPEPVGDYFAGPNHTLPTNGTAKFSSPLSVTDFQKKTSLIYYSKEALAKSSEAIITIANEEGLTAHANSISIRFKR